MAARIVQGLRRSEKGPWIVSHEDLLLLDKTIADEVARFEAHREAKIQKELGPAPDLNDKEANAERVRNEKHLRRYEAECEVLVSVTFRGGQRAEANAVADITRTPELEERVPIGLNLRIRTRDLSCELTIERDLWSSKATLEASPSSDPVAGGAYETFNVWLEGRRQPWFVRQIERSAPFIGVFAFVSALVSVLGALTSFEADETRTEAWKLATNGVKVGDEARALQLLLRLQVEGGLRRTPVPLWVWVSVAAAAAIIVGLVAMPSVEIAVGKVGRERVRYASWRTKLLWITVPTAILAAIVKMAIAALPK